MTSPVLETIGAIVARLKTDGTVAGLVGGRVYDSVPPLASFPYISLGPTDEIADDVDCIFGSEITLQIDIWSREGGAPQALRIAEAVKQALRADIELTDNALVSFEWRTTRRFRDPDGITNHAAMDFRALVEEPV